MHVSRSDSGLLVAENGASDERAVARALKEYDSDLRLLPPGVDIAGRPQPERVGYRVVRRAGSDRPPEFICFWGNDRSEPYPLSHRILDMVKTLDRNTRSVAPDPDVLNAEAREKQDRRGRDSAKDSYADMTKREGRSSLLPRGISLRRARSRTGYHDA